MLELSFNVLYGKLNKEVGYYGLYTTTPKEKEIPNTADYIKPLSVLVKDYYDFIQDVCAEDRGIILASEDEVFLRTYYQAYKNAKVPSLVVLVDDSTPQDYINMTINLGNRGASVCIIKLSGGEGKAVDFVTSKAAEIHAVSQIVDRMFIYHTSNLTRVTLPRSAFKTVETDSTHILGYYARLACARLMLHSEDSNLVVCRRLSDIEVTESTINRIRDLVTDLNKENIEKLLDSIEDTELRLNLNVFLELPSSRIKVSMERVSIIEDDLDAFEVAVAANSIEDSVFQDIYESVNKF